jgi:hypothetical protein
MEQAMGVDLQLLPLLQPNYWAAHDLIRVGQDTDLFKQIEALPQLGILAPVACYLARNKEDETVYGEIENSPYGLRLTFTRAADLLTLKDHEAVRTLWRNRAVWAYLEQMPADWPIILYWH